MVPTLRAAKATLTRIHSSGREVWGGKAGRGRDEVRERTSEGEPRWENVQARDVVAMVLLACLLFDVRVGVCKSRRLHFEFFHFGEDNHGNG
jgi:hypothetical protein